MRGRTLLRRLLLPLTPTLSPQAGRGSTQREEQFSPSFPTRRPPEWPCSRRTGDHTHDQSPLDRRSRRRQGQALLRRSLEAARLQVLEQSPGSLGYGQDRVALSMAPPTAPSRPTTNRVCMSASMPRTARAWIPSTPRPCVRADATTASPACARTTAPTTTPPSSSIPTAIASRPIAARKLEEAAHAHRPTTARPGASPSNSSPAASGRPEQTHRRSDPWLPSTRKS